MKSISISTYRNDALYPKVVRASARILQKSDEISPVAVLLEMGNLEPKKYQAWLRGEIPYLERVFQGSLSKANRILRLIGFHAHDLDMVPCRQTYRVQGQKRMLRFSKTGTERLERAYACHFRWNKTPEKKRAAIEAMLSEHR